MNKKLIRLTESDLKQIVKESVSKILSEATDARTDGALQYQWSDTNRRNAFSNKRGQYYDKMHKKLGRKPTAQDLGLSTHEVDALDNKVYDYDGRRDSDSSHGQPKYTGLEKVLWDCYVKLDEYIENMVDKMNLTDDDLDFVYSIPQTIYKYYEHCRKKNEIPSEWVK